MSLVLAGVGAWFAMAAFIALDGIWTLSVYRGRRFHAWLDAGPAWRDLPGAVVTTYCSCMTQAPVAARSSARATRWLAWASTLRPLALVTLLLLSPTLAGVYATLAIAYGVVVGRLGLRLSPAATFLVRTPGTGPIVADSLAETAGMLQHYGVVLAGCAGLGVVAWAWAPPLPVWAAVVAAPFVPVDLVAALPLLVGLHHAGTSPGALAVLVAGAVTASVRPRRLGRSYLRVEDGVRWDLAARVFPLVVAAAVA